MTDTPQPPSSATADLPDRPLTLDVLRQLVRQDWSKLPGTTLVVLSRGVEGNAYSPFASYSHARYAATCNDFVGEIFPSPEELAQDKELRELYPDGIPENAVAALALYPLG
jgi:hypothetical protein